jgi:hypothetical protein
MRLRTNDLFDESMVAEQVASGISLEGGDQGDIARAHA